MAARMRLVRTGSKKNPFYRIVVVDSHKPRNGKYVDMIGYYNPRVDPPVIEVNREKALDWIAKGATATYTTRSLLKRAGVFGAVHSEIPEAIEATEETIPIEETLSKDIGDLSGQENREEEPNPETSDNESGIA